MPLEGVTYSCKFMVFLCTVDCCQIKIAICIEEGNFAFQRLLNLTEVDLYDWEGVLNSEIEYFTSGNLIEANDFVVCSFYDCKNVRGDGYFLSAHKLN
jgi:hypothetical protein